MGFSKRRPKWYKTLKVSIISWIVFFPVKSFNTATDENPTNKFIIKVKMTIDSGHFEMFFKE